MEIIYKEQINDNAMWSQLFNLMAEINEAGKFESYFEGVGDGTVRVRIERRNKVKNGRRFR